MAASMAAVVNKEKSQLLRKELEKHGIWDSTRRLMLVNSTEIAIPVLSTADFSNYRHNDGYSLNGVEFRLENVDLRPSRTASKIAPHERLLGRVKALCAERGMSWSRHLADDVPSKWEVHSDLVLLPSDCFTSQQWHTLGDVLWHTVCSALSVQRLAMKSVICNDDYRTPQVRLLVGNSSWVSHMDNGITYMFDVTQCMFSAGNITEKLRVATFSCSGETVVDLYAGIGYFTLPYLVHAGASKVIACEWNPHAVQALKRSLVANKVSDRCVVLEGDNRKMCPVGVADRVNLGLIPSSEPGWHTACAALRPTGGVLHIHGNVTDSTTNTTPPHTTDGDTNSTPPPTADRDTYFTPPHRPDGDTNGIPLDARSRLDNEYPSPHRDPTDRHINSIPCVTEAGAGGTGTTLTVHESQNQTDRDENDTQHYRETPTDVGLMSRSHEDALYGLYTGESGQHVTCDSDMTNVNNVNIPQSVEGSTVHSYSQDEGDGFGSAESSLVGGTKLGSFTPRVHCEETRTKSSSKFAKTCRSKPCWRYWADQVSASIQTILSDIHEARWTTRILHIEHVKSYAPHVDHLVLDLACAPDLHT